MKFAVGLASLPISLLTCIMNIPRLLLSIVAVTVFLSLFQWLYHGGLIADLYAATPDAWRPMEEMQSLMKFMPLCYLMTATGFALAWAMVTGGDRKGLAKGALFGLVMFVFAFGGQLLGAIFQSFPRSILPWSALGGVIELVLAGLIVAAVYRPKPTA